MTRARARVSERVASVEETLAAARACYRRGDLAQAERLCRAVLSTHPQHAEAWYRLSRINLRAGLPALAMAFAGRALALAPSAPALHRALGDAQWAAGKWPEAEASVRRALALAPDDPDNYLSLAGMLVHDWRLTAGCAAARRAIALAPHRYQPHAAHAVALLYMGRAAEALAAFRHAAALAPGVPDPHAGVLFTQHYVAGVDREAMLAEARAWGARHADPLTARARPHLNAPDPHRRLRIGYVSPDLLEHPVGRILQAVLPAHDRAAVDVYCYVARRCTDEIAARLGRATDHWRSIVHLDDDAAAALIRADQIDVLVDLAGHSGFNRLLVSARKPAPVQALWLGYFDTTGMNAMDYIVADRYVCPPGDERYYVEQVARLPDAFLCYAPSESSPPVTPLPMRLRGHVTFACFNNLAKVSPETVALWAEILRALPEARLLMRSYGLGDAGVRARYRRLFADRGVAPDRLTLLGKASLTEYLATYRQADVALDPFPYSGGITTLDALWMGVPVVSLAGSHFAGRMTESILSVAGLPDLVARSPADYVRRAIALARDADRLAALRASLRERLARSPLCDGPRFTRGLEAAYRRMWEAWCAGQTARPR